MGRSLQRPSLDETGEFHHAASNSELRSFVSKGELRQTLRRGGQTVSYPVAFTIGSGNHARGYLVKQGSYLFQSPLAYYSKRQHWGVAPGYETNAHIDFNRPITEECLVCHSGRARPVAGTVNQYEDPPFAGEGISCDRCHGPVAAHLANPRRDTILTPSRLPAAARDSVCEQCHLGGESRILNPGARFLDMVPGARTEDLWSVFVFERPRTDLKVISHVEQLALSVCARASAKLWCGSCHSPHGPPVNVNAVCSGCHAKPSAKVHGRAAGDCANCHMEKRRAVDGGHAAFTDHRIARHPLGSGAAGQGAASPAAVALRAWRAAPDSHLAKRNLGLAYIAVGERDGSADAVNRGYALLAEVYPHYQRDAETLAAMGMVLFLKDQPAEAARLLNAAIAARPQDPLLYDKLAIIRRAQGDTGGAVAALERSIELDPGREAPYHALAAYQGRSALERLLRVIPQSLLTREALRNLSARP